MRIGSFLVLAQVWLACSLHAATGAWNQNGGGLWSSTNNWSGSVPAVSGDIANLTNNISASVVVTNDLSRTIGALNIGDTGSPYFPFTLTNNPGATLTFDNSGLGARIVQAATTAADLIAMPLVLADNLAITNSSQLTLSAAISGAGGNVTKAGAGTVIFSGANTYTGGTVVNDGTLSMLRPTVSSTSGFSVNSAGTLQFDSNGSTWTYSSATVIGLNGGILSYTADALHGRYVVVNTSVTVNSPSTITVHAGSAAGTLPNNSSLFLDSGLQGSVPVTISSDTAGVGVVLRNSNSDYSGTMTVNGIAATTAGAGGGLAIGSNPSNPALGNANIVVNGTMELGNAAGMGWASGTVSGQTFQMGALGGTGVVVANMGASGSTRTLSVGNNNEDASFSGVIADGVNNTLSLVKAGNGTQILSGNNTYTGGTTVSAGTLQFGNGLGDVTISGPIANNASVVFDSYAVQQYSGNLSGTGSLTKIGGGTLHLTGVCAYTGLTDVQAGSLSLLSSFAGAGSMLVEDNASLNLTIDGSFQLQPATLTLGGAAGATVNFSGLLGTTAAPIKAGSLLLNGTNTINILSAPFAAGVYPLIQFSSVSGTGSVVLGEVPPGLTAHLDTSGNVIRLIVDAAVSFSWIGAVSGFWDTNTPNWASNGLACTFASGAQVQFDDTAARYSVTNLAPVSPGDMRVTNDTADYTFSGAPIAGTAGLFKAGAGRLTLNGANTFADQVTVSGGILEINGSLEGGNIAVNGGTLAGTGSIGNAVSIAPGCNLQPGTASNIGTLTLSNSLALAGTVTMRISRTGGIITHDLVHGMTSLTYGGLLNVTNLTEDGTPLVAGNRFHLFDATSYSGNFTATNLPTLDAGLKWAWTPASGTLAVVNATNAGTGDYVFYVSPNGNDVTGDGSLNNPWQTIEQARDYIRDTALNIAMTGNITVYLRGGRYQLDQTLQFTSEDSAEAGYYITYASYPGEQARLSGGRLVTGWTQVAGKPYWVASVPTNAGFADYFRQLYVNGIRAERAHSDWFTNAGFFDNPATADAVDGVTFTPANFKSYSRPTDLRMLRIGNFKIDEFPVTSVSTNSTNGLIQVELQQPYFQARYNYGSGPSDINSVSSISQWMVIQALEELNEPGEWYLDRVTQQVYYYPYSFEDMTTAEVYAPTVETLLSLTGASTTSKVRNLRFQNLIFEHGNWLFPREYMIGGTQAEILMPPLPPDASTAVPYAYEVPGQVVLNNTVAVQFIGNTFQHLASCGIQPFNGARDTLIQGNIFYDLTAAAVIGGRWGQDAVIVNQEICTNTTIADNVIRKIGLDYLPATAIDNLTHYGFQASHNDVADSQYMGFHQRTAATTIPASAGTGGTIVSFNRITLANNGSRYGVGDGAYLYSDGVWPNSTFQGNDLFGIDAPTGQMRGMMYDDNSYGLVGLSNVVRNVKAGLNGYLLYTALSGYKNMLIDSFGDATANNFSAVSNINFSTFSGTPPPTAQAIINYAGLEPAYTNLLQFLYSGDNLAQGKTAWASSQSGANTASAAVDWNFSTVWQPAAADTNQCWWAVDLGAPYVIRRLEIAANSATNQPDARCNFRVDAANDAAFSNPTVLSEQNATPFAYRRTGLANSWVKYPNSPQAFRYLRVIKTAPGALNFSEVRVYGYSLATTPVALAAVPAGNSLFLSWPPDHLGWRLQVQTNRMDVGLGSNWVNWPGSAAVTSTNVPIVPRNSAVFFRLIYP